ncbi:hypothetical protein CLOP_g24163 [Closterium sp. NIES-67]|nr:hypothetical protein CLOP_g24163 [Closterium sp. NIES-67]
MPQAAESPHLDVSDHGASIPEANAPAAGGAERFDVPHDEVSSQPVAGHPERPLETSQPSQLSLAKDWSSAHQSDQPVQSESYRAESSANPAADAQIPTSARPRNPGMPSPAVTGITSDSISNGVTAYPDTSVASSSSSSEKSLPKAEAAVAATSGTVAVAAAPGDAAAAVRGATGETGGESGNGAQAVEGMGAQLQQAQAQLQAQLQEQLQALENVLSLLGLGVASAANPRGRAELGEEWGDGGGGANGIGGEERESRRREDLAVARAASRLKRRSSAKRDHNAGDNGFGSVGSSSAPSDSEGSGSSSDESTALRSKYTRGPFVNRTELYAGDSAASSATSATPSPSPSPLASSSDAEAGGAERKVLERAVVEMALLQEVSRGGIEGSSLEDEWGELRQAVSQDPQLSRLYNEYARDVLLERERQRQEADRGRTVVEVATMVVLTVLPIAAGAYVYVNVQEWLKGVGPQPAVVEKEPWWMLFGPAASAAGTVFGMAGLGFAAKTAAAAPVAVAVVPQMDALWRSFGGASLVALYWRTLVFGKTFRSIEWDLEAYDAPNGSMKSITIRVPSLNAVRAKIALANGLEGASEVQQLALWIPNSGDFVEPLRLAKDLALIPDFGFVIWSRTPATLHCLPSRAAKTVPSPTAGAGAGGAAGGSGAKGTAPLEGVANGGKGDAGGSSTVIVDSSSSTGNSSISDGMSTVSRSRVGNVGIRSMGDDFVRGDSNGGSSGWAQQSEVPPVAAARNGGVQAAAQPMVRGQLAANGAVAAAGFASPGMAGTPLPPASSLPPAAAPSAPAPAPPAIAAAPLASPAPSSAPPVAVQPVGMSPDTAVPASGASESSWRDNSGRQGGQGKSDADIAVAMIQTIVAASAAVSGSSPQGSSASSSTPPLLGNSERSQAATAAAAPSSAPPTSAPKAGAARTDSTNGSVRTLGPANQPMSTATPMEAASNHLSPGRLEQGTGRGEEMELGGIRQDGGEERRREETGVLAMSEAEQDELIERAAQCDPVLIVLYRALSHDPNRFMRHALFHIRKG